MRIILTSILLVASLSYSFGQEKINLVILRNGKLIENGLANIRLNGHYIEYWTGELTVEDSVFNLLMQDSTFYLQFDYYIQSKRKQTVRNFGCEILLKDSTIPYQVLEVFDFTDPQYRKWYSYHTDKDFLCELRFPNSGIYIPKGAKIKD